MIKTVDRYLGKIFCLALLAVVLSGCDAGFRQMGATEYGVKFRSLPTFLGGGVAQKILMPGEMALIWPWDTIYHFDTAVQDISWGPAQDKAGETEADFVNTRALDGNEVALAVTVRFKISSDPDKLRKMITEVAITNDQIRDLVVSIGRADIRTYMNELKTAEFLSKDPRYKAVDEAKASMQKRLGEYGIEVLAVNLDDFQFERQKSDGTVDSSYQEKLKEIQRLREETARERSRIETVRAKKLQQLNEAQAWVNEEIAKADGYLNQAKFQGDSYLASKQNVAKGILAKGQAEVKGLSEQIEALSGPGGRDILKLKIVQELLRDNPRFVVIEDGGAGGVAVNRTDTNDLLNQLGVFEGLYAPDSSGKASSAEAATAGNPEHASSIKAAETKQ